MSVVDGGMPANSLQYFFVAIEIKDTFIAKYYKTTYQYLTNNVTRKDFKTNIAESLEI